MKYGLFRNSVLVNLYLTLLCCDSRDTTLLQETTQKREIRHSTSERHWPKEKTQPQR